MSTKSELNCIGDFSVVTVKQYVAGASFTWRGAYHEHWKKTNLATLCDESAFLLGVSWNYSQYWHVSVSVK